MDAGTAPLGGGSLTVNGLLDVYLDGIDADGQLSAKTKFDHRHGADSSLAGARKLALTVDLDDGLTQVLKRQQEGPNDAKRGHSVVVVGPCLQSLR